MFGTAMSGYINFLRVDRYNIDVMKTSVKLCHRGEEIATLVSANKMFAERDSNM